MPAVSSALRTGHRRPPPLPSVTSSTVGRARCRIDCGMSSSGGRAAAMHTVLVSATVRRQVAANLGHLGVGQLGADAHGSRSAGRARRERCHSVRRAPVSSIRPPPPRCGSPGRRRGRAGGLCRRGPLGRQGSHDRVPAPMSPDWPSAAGSPGPAQGEGDGGCRPLASSALGPAPACLLGIPAGRPVCVGPAPATEDRTLGRRCSD